MGGRPHSDLRGALGVHRNYFSPFLFAPSSSPPHPHRRGARGTLIPIGFLNTRRPPPPYAFPRVWEFQKAGAPICLLREAPTAWPTGCPWTRGVPQGRRTRGPARGGLGRGPRGPEAQTIPRTLLGGGMAIGASPFGATLRATSTHEDLSDKSRWISFARLG